MSRALYHICVVSVFFFLPGVSAQPGCMQEKWISLCWEAHLSVRITCCLCRTTTKLKRFSNTWTHATTVSVQLPAIRPFSICLPYFILSVGHGAIKRPLLKLEVTHIQLLCEHATWRHRDLWGDSCTCVCFSIYMHSTSLPVHADALMAIKIISLFKTHVHCSFLSQNLTHHSGIFSLLQCRYQCCSENVCTWK